MFKRILKTRRGFTLIELMIVVTIVGILAAIAAPNYQWGVIKAREAVLLDDLYNLNSMVDQYYADHGQYPESLQDLVAKKYIDKIPKDPFTKSSDSWVVIPPEPSPDGQETMGAVAGVKSGSNLIGSNGKPYSEWP